jgi:hypothetical protein
MRNQTLYEVFGEYPYLTQFLTNDTIAQRDEHELWEPDKSAIRAIS